MDKLILRKLVFGNIRENVQLKFGKGIDAAIKTVARGCVIEVFERKFHVLVVVGSFGVSLRVVHIQETKNIKRRVFLFVFNKVFHQNRQLKQLRYLWSAQ